MDIDIKIGGRYKTSTSYFIEIKEIKGNILICNRLRINGYYYTICNVDGKVVP
tara:strand:- start:211 stop:369 length:159 start_codon:yes stop_codon:yes gene_type:complete